MNKVLLASISLIFIILSSSTSFAFYREPCKVKYQTQDGWSKTYEVECNYMSGLELNQQTKTAAYNSFNIYTVVYWSENQTTIIKLSNYTSCGSTAKARCAKSFMNLDGLDQEGRNWKVCDFDNFCQ